MDSWALYEHGFIGTVLNMDPNVSFHTVSVSLDLTDVSFDICGGAGGNGYGVHAGWERAGEGGRDTCRTAFERRGSL